MLNTPFEQIGQETLYEMIDIFYRYVAHDTRINHLFPGDFEETSRKQKQFLTQFLGGPTLYSDEHGHPMLRGRHMPFTIGSQEKDAWLENMYRAAHEVDMDKDVRTYLLQRLTLTAEHMVNAEY
ncbi:MULTISPECIES: globin [Staphylococcaceae]|uniref:Globin n=3 Tax=Staphylococcaceae TaxID=90964 RepID=A0ACC9MUK7_9STAP|nr:MULTISPECIES: globin [Macrococcus]MBQ5153048.1 globin [Macrococcus caseolyticus]MDJ1088817.1 globin [Macrococcus caseolyticus]MDJ1090190.1 globin [Macrococcus caseolyticus]MDJ1109093.1 globin [Macrococcus caseolyticus]MDJ1110981.1 globin [Macrococcus sp. S115]